jgi:superfamily II DNA or RNA helicase
MTDVKNVIKIENVYSWLITENMGLRETLCKALKVPAKNYWHSTAYKRKIWDGHIEFFKKNSGMFYSGLLPEVCGILSHLNEPYTIADHRGAIQWGQKVVDENFLQQFQKKGSKPLTLYDYQVEYVNLALKYGRGVITAPTGAGKTNVLISILKCLPPKTPVLFMTKGAGLVDQNYAEMLQWGVPNLGRYYGKYKEPNYVMCCTIHQDTLKSIDKLLPKFKVLIVDEVHEAMSDTPIAAYKKMKEATYRFGFSATPFKYTSKDNKGNEISKDKEHKYNVKAHFGANFKLSCTPSGKLTTKDLQERGILSPSRCTIYPINEPDNIQHEPYGDAVTLGISNNMYFHQVIMRLARKLEGRTLIMVERIDQGNYLKSLIPEAHWIKGDVAVGDRATIFGELKYSGEKVICIAMRQIVTAGINVFVHNLINASGGNAEHNIIQQMGRGLRSASDKNVLDFYDFLFTTNAYLRDHSLNRIRVLESEGHEITVKEKIDF